MGLRETDAFVTPSIAGPRHEDSLEEYEMRVVELPGGVLEVHDPLFDEPYRFGDRSLVTDPVADEYIVASWQHSLVSASTRQLSNTEWYETKLGTASWARKQHQLSAAAMTAKDGGTPIEIMQMDTHDEGHRIGSHQMDDLLAPRGEENAHDHRLPVQMRRNGFISQLGRRGLVGPLGFLRPDGTVHVTELFDLDAIPNGHVGWSGKTGNLEQERKQYIAQEGAIWGFGVAVMREALTRLHRMPDSPEGDQLVFDDVEAAIAFEITQIRCYAEHWSDPVNDVVDELLITAHRRMLTSRDHIMAATNQYHPVDTMNTLEEDWDQLREAMADNDPFIGALIKIAKKLAASQREPHAQLDAFQNRYNGPILPDWITIQQSLLLPTDNHQRIVSGRTKHQSGNTITLEMKPGKARAINPWIKLPGQDMRRLEDIAPWVKAYREEQSRWCGKPYDAVIDLDHPALGLSKQEKSSMARTLQQIDQEWPAVLRRPDMPDELFQAETAAATSRYRTIGRLLVPANAVKLRKVS